MSIPAQGRRSVLFPPPGVKIRRTVETQFVPGTPTMIAGHDSRRVLLIVMVDMYGGPHISFAGSKVGLDTTVTVGNGYPMEVHFAGPEEVWALCVYPTSPPGGNILVQSVFYD